MDELKLAGEILKKKNKEGLQEIVATLLPQAIENLAKGTATPIDDVLAAALKQPLVNELSKLIEKI